MSISIHIPFYNPNPEKTEGYRNLSRFDYLLENISTLKKLSFKTDIFIHTHNDFLDNKKIDAKIIKHELNQEDLDKGYLTWLTRKLMEKQKNNYEYFMYLEHDIKFTESNLQYWLKHHNNLAHKNFHLGFLIYEQNHNDNNKYSIHIIKKLKNYVTLNNQKYLVNDWDNYCCFWLYDKKQFNSFIKTKWWNFEKKLTNFRHNYGLTERSALGYHAFNIGYFKATLIPELKDEPDPDCKIEHLTNNYFERFSDLKKNDFLDIRGACRFKINEIFESKDKQIHLSNYFYLNKIFKIFLWKLRFITRKFN